MLAKVNTKIQFFSPSTESIKNMIFIHSYFFHLQSKSVDFKSHYNKTKISEMDISNIYLKNESFEIFAQD